MDGLLQLLKRSGRFLLLLLVVYGAVTAVAFFVQERLLFFPQPVSSSSPGAEDGPLPESHSLEEVTIPVGEGVTLHGWFLQASGGPQGPLVIYFGGNAEEVSWQIPVFSRLEDHHVLLVNYRGYGRSEGRPGEEALLNDSLTLYDWALSRPEVDPRGVVAMGRSLGTGVAVHLAAHRPLAGVILVSPYDSMVSVARTHYWFLPIDTLIRHRFHSDRLAPSVETPALFLTAENDRVVRQNLSWRLSTLWEGPVIWKSLANRDHNSLLAYEEDWTPIYEFLEELGSPYAAEVVN